MCNKSDWIIYIGIRERIDASRLHGLGFAMGHFIDGKLKVVACGSKSLTPTQQRYATIELECLAVHFAVDKFYLKFFQCHDQSQTPRRHFR